MIRYVISFPPEANIRADFLQQLGDKLKEAADAREWRDIVMSHGGTITDMRGKPVAALVRRARALAR